MTFKKRRFVYNGGVEVGWGLEKSVGAKPANDAMSAGRWDG